jgi:hypothetical protein
LHEHDRACQPDYLDADRRQNPAGRRRLDRWPHSAQTRHQGDDRDPDADRDSDKDPGADQLVLEIAVARYFRRLALSGRNA